jgi:methyltransferase
MLSWQIFVAFVLLVALERLIELRVSQRNERYLRGLGAREHAAGHYIALQWLHTLWLASILLEVTLLRPPLVPWLSVAATLCFAVGQFLRYAAMRALGRRWSVRVFTVPGAAPVTHGIYRYLRHPNYLGVGLEIAALPLMHSAWRTAAVFSLANAVVLRVRIREEERALRRNGGYDEALGGRPRLWPSFRSRGAA